MDNANDLQSDRSGGTAPSHVDASELLRTPKITLGDIDDLGAYVREIVKAITNEENELDEFVAEGITLAYERYNALRSACAFVTSAAARHNALEGEATPRAAVQHARVALSPDSLSEQSPLMRWTKV